MAPVSATGTSRHGQSAISAAVGLSPRLAFLLVRLIARLFHRVLWSRPEAAPPSVDERAANLRNLGGRHSAELPRPTLIDLGRVSLTGSSRCPRRGQFQGKSPKKTTRMCL
jgi:hypothetical protein